MREDAEARQPIFFFGAFHLDPANARLRRGTQAIPLNPKPFAVLHYLLQHSERLVTKEEMLSAIWSKVIVCDSALRVCIREIRRVLCDECKTPRFIETVNRRGYRFIGEVSVCNPRVVPSQGLESERDRVLVSSGPALRLTPPAEVWLPGRDQELAHLYASLERGLQGSRQLVFITGEVGIGKSALLEAFMARACARHVRIALCRCFKHHGRSRGYLPMLEALVQLLRQPGADDVLAILRKVAPSWLAQIPSLSGDERKGLASEMVSDQRMLLEFVQAVQAISTTIPLALIIEDLHWSAHPMVDVMALLAGQRGAARVIVLASYRPEEVVRVDHPLKALKRELWIRGLCTELELTGLNEEGVADYLQKRFSGCELPWVLRKWLHQHTDGNPLFLVNTVGYLLQAGLLIHRPGMLSLKIGVAELASLVPPSVFELIEDKFERLSEGDRILLESASVLGLEFSARALASLLQKEMVEIEARCEKLVRSAQFLRASGHPHYPERRLASRYAFVHGLYRNGLYQRIPIARRASLRERIPQYLAGPSEIAGMVFGGTLVKQPVPE